MDYKEDDVIIFEKSDSRFMYLVLDGAVALYTNYKTPDEYLYGVVSRNRTFGEVGLLTHSRSPYTAVATTDVKVAVFSEHELGAFVRNYPEQSLGIMRSIAKMSRVFSLNLKMVLEEHKNATRFEEICADALQMPENHVVEAEGAESGQSEATGYRRPVKPEWRSSAGIKNRPH